MSIPNILGTPQLTENASAGTSLTPAPPSGIVAGEVGIVIIGTDSANQTTDTFNTPVGLTKVGAILATNTNIDVVGCIYRRTLTGDSGDTVGAITWTGAGEAIAYYFRTDADPDDPINILGSPGQANGAPTIPSITTDLDNCLAFYVVIGDGSNTSVFSQPSTWTEQIDRAWQDGTSGNAVGLAFGTKDMASQSATGTAAPSPSSTDGCLGIQFALNEIQAVSSDIAATIATSLAVAADLDAIGNLSQANTLSLAIAADLSAQGKLEAAAIVLLAIAADLKGAGELQAANTLTMAVLADIDAAGALNFSAAMTLNMAPDLDAQGKLELAASIIMTQVADVTPLGGSDIAATMSTLLSIAADLKGLGRLDAALSLLLTLAADITAVGSFTAAVTIVATVTANINALGLLATNPQIVMSVLANVTSQTQEDMAAAISISKGISADLTAQGKLEVVLPTKLVMAANVVDPGAAVADTGWRNVWTSL